jgi:O-antigen biosynthesis alpha-1,2-rhamnosyltransferase
MKIFVDVSETVSNQLRTGIQRVVREVVAHSETVGKKLALEVIPVVVKGKSFYRLINLDPLLNLPSLQTPSAEVCLPVPRPWAIRLAKRALKSVPFAYPLAIKLLLTFRRNQMDLNCSRQPIRVTKRDVLLLLDSFWSGGGTLKAAARFRKRGGVVLTVIYDVIPITYPQYCDAANVTSFANAFPIALAVSDGVIAISNAVANEIRCVMAKKNEEMPVKLPVDYFHLGADFTEKNVYEALHSDNWPHGLWEGSSVFMMVGTIEPRKGHEFVLDAFEHRWREGSTEKLLILGKVGWKTEALINRIINSPYYGIQLFMVNQATDMDLKEAYQRAYACIMASYAEGFGLPLIEALQQRVPVIASDIPVFREIAGNDAEFFSLGDVPSFNKAIDTLQLNYKTTKAKLENYKWLTWEESTEQLLRKVVELSQEKT